MHYAVYRAWGPAWDRSRSLREQEKWAEHAVYMDALVDDGFIVLGGPLGDGAMLIVDVDDEEEIEPRFAADPWTPMEMLQTASVDRWQILLGGIEKQPDRVE
jgi:hypothetical protein